MLSVSYATTYYTVATAGKYLQSDHLWRTELRYLFSPLLTLGGRGLRYSPISYANRSRRARETPIFCWLGTDLTLSRRLSATIRMGEDIRDIQGERRSKSSPYLELSSTYALTRATSLQSGTPITAWKNRPTQITTVEVLRTGFTLSQSLTPRLIGNLDEFSRA